jgi:hypothetical protein
MTANAGLGAFALTIEGDAMADARGKYISFLKDDLVFFDPDERPFFGLLRLSSFTQ